MSDEFSTKGLEVMARLQEAYGSENIFLPGKAPLYAKGGAAAAASTSSK
jgi:hypothetical protein